MPSDALNRVTAKQFKDLASADDLDAARRFVICKSGPAIIKNEGENRVLEFVISTGDIDRDGDTIAVDGWDLNAFAKGGSVLWAHDSSSPPIAKPIATWVEGTALKSRAQFTSAEEYEFGDMIRRLVVGGYVRSASVGFRPLEWTNNEERGGFMPIDFQRQELTEWSVVPVPANPNALVDAAAKGIGLGPLREWVTKVLDQDDSVALVLPRDVAEQLQHVVTKRKSLFDFSPVEKTPDEPEPIENGEITNPGGEPPKEEPPVEEPPADNEPVEALPHEQSQRDLEQLLENIDTIKAGRVLSAANENRLARARDLLTEVLEQLSSQDDDDEDEKSFDLSNPQVQEAIASLCSEALNAAFAESSGQAGL